jgi:hypothetical protein
MIRGADCCAWLAASWIALTGCDGVGRSLVGRSSDGKGGDLACEPPPCRDMPFSALQIPEPAAFATTSCTPPAPELCEPANENEPLLEGERPGGCRRTISLDDDAFDAGALRSLGCGRARLIRTQADSTTVRVEGADWSHIDLDLQTADPVTLELVAPVRLEQLIIRMRGPFTLRVSESNVVHDIRVASDSPDASVMLEKTELQTIRFGDEQAQFAGVLAVKRSKLAQVNLVARELRFETVGVIDARVRADDLQWVDVTGRRVELTVGSAVLSSSNLVDLRIKECELLSLHDVDASSYVIPTCSGGPTRLFDSRLGRGSLEGVIQSDRTELFETILGLHDTTDLLAWETTLGTVNFCSNSDHVTIAGKGTFTCATCRELDGSQVPIDACVHEDSQTLFLKTCGAIFVAPDCDPTPDRMRPPFK